MAKFGKRISQCIKEKMEEIEPISKRPYNCVLTDVVFSIAMDKEASNKDRVTAIEFIVDRAEGKPVNTNINAEIPVNPFEGIDTAKLEALKYKLTGEK